MSAEAPIPPPAIWAQRNDVVFLTLNVECNEPTFKFTADSLHFEGVGLPEKRKYEIIINFFSQINPDKVVSKNIKRCIEFVIPKADLKAPYWPRLLKEKSKPHWLKVDFNRWKDEGSDDDGEDEHQQSLDDLLVDNDGKKLSLNDFDDDQEDSDDDEMPGLHD